MVSTMKHYNKFVNVCADEADLIALKRNDLDEDSRLDLVEHLAVCDRCAFAVDFAPVEEDQNELDWRQALVSEKAIVKDIAEAFRKQVEAEAKLDIRTLDDVGSSGLVAGQIWRTKIDRIVLPTLTGPEVTSILEMASVPRLVVIANPFVENLYAEESHRAYRIVEVIPVTDNVEYADSGDLVLSDDDSPLGYAVMLEVWNRQQMIFDNLDSCLATIQDDAIIRQYICPDKTPEYDLGDYSWFGLLKSGGYSDQKMRFRAREFENTAYLRDPVLALRDVRVPVTESATFGEGLAKSWRDRVVGLLTVSTPSHQHAAASDTVHFVPLERTYFGGMLLLRLQAVTENDQEVSLRSTNPIFKDKLVMIGTRREPLLMALMSADELEPGSFTATIGIQSREELLVDDSSEDAVYSAESLSEMLDKQIHASLIEASISAVSASGLSPWRKLADALPAGDPLRRIILCHPRLT